MNDGERLLRGKHIGGQAADFERIDLTVERIHGLFARSYYDLRKMAEHGRDAGRLDELRRQYDRTYLALRDITSGFLRLEQSHDRLYELMGDDEVRTYEARQAARRRQQYREQEAREAEEERMRRGFRKTHHTPGASRPAPKPVVEDEVDATMMAGFNAADVEQALREARAATAAQDQQAAEELDLDPTLQPGMLSAKDIEAALLQRNQEQTRARPAMPEAPSLDDDWDMATMKVSARDLAAALKERGIE